MALYIPPPENLPISALTFNIFESAASSPRSVPFISQLNDITSPVWKRNGCGIASLAMVIDYYKPDTVSADTLLSQGLAAGAFLSGIGWKHHDLVDLSVQYGLGGDNYDLSDMTKNAAFSKLKEFLKDGPIIASVHYKFDPKNPIPHLVVINDVDGDVLHYNDPAAAEGNKELAVSDFLKAWKKRFIVVRPTTEE